jgi:hypothetical protein
MFLNKNANYVVIVILHFDLVTRPSDCSELDKSTCKSGVYKIFPDNTGFEVYCEMEKYGGGWTVSDIIGLGGR